MAHISSWSRWRSTMRSVQWTSECSKQVQIFNLSSSAMHNVAHSFLRRLPIKLYTWGQDSMWHHHSGAQYYQPCFNRLSDIKQYNIICLGMPVYSLGGGSSGFVWSLRTEYHFMEEENDAVTDWPCEQKDWGRCFFEACWLPPNSDPLANTEQTGQIITVS